MAEVARAEQDSVVPSVVTNQGSVHTSSANPWFGTCTFGSGCGSFVPLGKGMEALRKLPRAFCGRGLPQTPMIPILKGEIPNFFGHWFAQSQI